MGGTLAWGGAGIQALYELGFDLLAARDATRIPQIVCARACAELGATMAAVFVRRGDVLRQISAEGYPDDVRRLCAEIPLSAELPSAATIRTGEAQWFSEEAEILARYPGAARLTANLVNAHVVLPLTQGGQPLGAATFSFREPKVFDADERSFLLATGRILAGALGCTLAEEERARTQAALALLSDAGLLMVQAARDYRRALEALAYLCVRHMADWCSVYLLTGNESHDLTVAHRLPEKAAVVRAIYARWPIPADSPYGLPAILRSGKSQLMTHFTDAQRQAVARDAEHLAMLRELGATSSIVVPLRRLGERQPIGALVLSRGEGRDAFDQADLSLAEELALRATAIVDHARTFEDLLRERARAAEALRAKDDFLAVVSHELRSPLNAISGWAQILASASHGDVTVGRAVQVIERNARAQARLIDDLLDIARISSGKLRLSMAEIDAARIVETAVQLLQPAAQAKGLHVEVDVESTAPIVADPVRVQQIATNLVSNAVKFTPAGGRVWVTLRGTESGVELTVKDTGIGIAPDSLRVVWDHFRQIDGNITRDQGGLGLGLAIVRQLAELHGGTVSAESEGLGRGAVFAVHLPRAAVDRRSESRPPSDPPDASSRPSIVGMRVLVVEDEPESRAMMTELLLGLSAEVRGAESVADALREVDSFQPEVIISDIAMPHESGLALAQRLRAREAGKGGAIPMIALTGFASEGDRSRALLAGFDAHARKPVDVGDLVSLLASYRRP